MYRFFKRVFDVLLSFFVILVFSPILFLITIALKFTAEGEVFYLQKRIGYKNSIFKIWKFATMLKNSMNMGTGNITLENDFRVTRFGKILRKTKINELPQLFNILKGEISIVGPRPLVTRDFEAYPLNIQKIIYNVKPGLTGIGSIVFRDEEKIISENYDKNDPHIYYKEVIAPYKGVLELYYQKNQSFILDLKIIFLTAWVILFSNSNLHFKLFKDLPKRSF
jgi:lipopolysaccharide/colanic/teichoic acid biosynthesis glycosyltransferase